MKQSVSRSELGIYFQALVALTPLIFLSFALSSVALDQLSLFNRVAPFYFIGVLLFSAFRIAKTNAANIWTPAFWLLICTSVFFGFGPLVEVYGNEMTRYRLSVHNLAITSAELFYANRLSYFSSYMLMVGFTLHLYFNRRIWRRAADPNERSYKGSILNPHLIILTFVVGGMLVVHGIIMPASWGMIDMVVPGAISSMAAIVDVGFALATYMALRGSRPMTMLIILLWPLHLFLTALAFAKAPIITALMLPAIGAFLAHRSILRLAVASAVLMVTYSLANEYVYQGRVQIYNETGTIWNADYERRLEIAQSYFTEERALAAEYNPRADEQSWWMRLNYSNVQVMAMEFRENGTQMDTLSQVWSMFIPRFLWPDKPIYTSPGNEFYYLVNGHEGSSFGVTVFGDIYWQFGWTGTIFILPLLGWFYAMISWRAVKAMQQRSFINMPLVLISILLSTSALTNFLANGIIAFIPVYVAYAIMAKSAEGLFTKTQPATNKQRRMVGVRPMPNPNVGAQMAPRMKPTVVPVMRRR